MTEPYLHGGQCAILYMIANEILYMLQMILLRTEEHIEIQVNCSLLVFL